MSKARRLIQAIAVPWLCDEILDSIAGTGPCSPAEIAMSARPEPGGMAARTVSILFAFLFGVAAAAARGTPPAPAAWQEAAPFVATIVVF